MPLRVDHEERRRHIAECTQCLIAQVGLDKVTLRDVAKSAGFSPTIIGHYFRDKLDLLTFTSANACTSAAARVERALASGTAPLQCLEEYLPLDEQRKLEWRAWFGLWSKAASEPDIAAVRMCGTRHVEKMILNLLRKAQKLRQIPPEADLDYGVMQVLVLIDGMGCLVAMAPDSWPPERQRFFFRAEFAKMLKLPDHFSSKA